MEEIKQALDLKAELDTLRPINEEQEGRIMQKFRLDWNYHSNHLEGNTLTYGETKALIMFGVTAQGKPLKDTLEMTGHNEAIDWVLDMVKGERPLTENFIRELHTVLLVKPYQVDAITPDGKPTKKWIAVGSYKETPNHVETKTGEMFYFATPEETGAEMTALLDWYTEKSKEENVNPILLAAEFHYRFILIHPFDDGNGRTARILMNFILMKFGYPPTIIKSDRESKEEYFAVLQLADAGNIEPFIDFIAANLSRSLQIMIAGAKGENIEEPDDLDKEIALLEQRLSGIGEKSKVAKSDNIIRHFLTYDVRRIVDKITVHNIKFNKFYILNEIRYYINMNIINIDMFDNLNYEEEAFPVNDLSTFITQDNSFKDILEIEIINSFERFNTIGFDAFDYTSVLKIVFSDISYSVIVEGKKTIEKPYDIQLTEIEIDKIIQFKSKRHKEFIEQKIAEKENKS